MISLESNIRNTVTRMKLLIGYDGSYMAEAILNDLEKAGLPENVEAMIVTVAEIWMPLPPIGSNWHEFASRAIPGWIKKHSSISESALSEARIIGDSTHQRLKSKFPDWNICLEVSSGSPAREILAKAAAFKPDLIIVGSQGKNATGHLFPGSTTRKILSEADCSVRVARNNSQIDKNAARIVIGFDGSRGAETAVEAVAARNWGKHGEVRLITVVDSVVPNEITRFVSTVADLVEEEKRADRLWVDKLANNVLRKLSGCGLNAELVVCEGNPKKILLEQARAWSADCIFVGSHSAAGGPERFPIGGTSVATAERAHCSVEVVR